MRWPTHFAWHEAVPLEILARLFTPIPQTLQFAGCITRPDALQSPEAAEPMNRRW
jgi:hypothetical protein